MARTCDQLPKNYFVGHFSSDGGAPANDTVGVELCIPEGNPNNMPAYAQMFVSNEQGYLIDVGGISLPTSGTKVDLNSLVQQGEVCSLTLLHSHGEPTTYTFQNPSSQYRTISATYQGIGLTGCPKITETRIAQLRN